MFYAQEEINFFLLPKTCNIILRFSKHYAIIFLHELIFVYILRFIGTILGKMKHRKNIINTGGLKKR